MSGPTSAEQLEALRESGRISANDYENLKRAMTARRGVQSEQAGVVEEQAPLARRWSRSPERIILAGVCGGIAEGSGLNVWGIRTAFAAAVVAQQMLLPGLPESIAILAYVVLWIALPFDPLRLRLPGSRVSLPGRGEIMLFGAFIASRTIITCAFLIFVAPSLLDMYSEMGRTLPALTRAAVHSELDRAHGFWTVYRFGIAPVLTVVLYSYLARPVVRRLFFAWEVLNFVLRAIGFAIPFYG